MYCRQLAWLGATPEKHKVSRLEAIRNPTRIIEPVEVDSDLPEDKIKVIPKAPLEAHLPEIDPAFSYLRELFYSAGQAKSTGMGLVALDWTELRNWRKELKIKLCVWERELIHKMSTEYCREYSLATDPHREAPYAPIIEEEQEFVAKIKMAEGFRDFLAAFRPKLKGK